MSASEAALLIVAGLLVAVGAVLIAAGGYGSGILAVAVAGWIAFRVYRRF